MSNSYQIPRKVILTEEQLKYFQNSATHETIINYIESLNTAVAGVKLTDQCTISPAAQAIIDVLQRVQDLVAEIPPVDNKASRFGNPAFRTFYDRVSEISPSLHASIPGLPADAVPEVSLYFCEAWGNRTRIDYGSGMELNFLCWLLCLEKLGVVGTEDHVALVIRVFWKYIQVMRTLQSTYWLEPAGSHGVWGLDDYHFLPFLLGSAQLKGHKHLRPKSIHDSEILDEFSKDYLYLACIQFINSIKTASLRWHSPMLDDISAVKTWDKLNAGMIKMYRGEVLGKLPVIQHFLFGSILAWDGPMAPSPTEEDEAHAGHAHVKGAATWGDCCGIPVPSAFGAAVAEGRAPGVKLGGPAVRPVPFD
ncbi:Phosphotyrosyl phosphatase activator [Cristinia sonorae]|uniref:Serine/threonine-protein phosphatase 2A activator n=1 Tax=Cristinia sonorae TaxID=1940300 RepID=A0A8K0UM72_9AGAR|nr:Phosphotyrosyl phosphatase activator [Cristinia sonorae]